MKKLAALSSALGYLLLTTNVFAEDVKIDPTQVTGLKTFTTLQSLINNLILIVFIVASFLVLAMLLWGGIEWILSAGDKEKVGNARKRILNAIIGLVILALTFLILTILGQLIGFSLLGSFTLPVPS